MNSAGNNGSAPDISIVVPMYNVAEFLQECLDSIAAQDFDGSWELLLVDDCSPDNSLEICRAWMRGQSQQVILLENESNQGVSMTRNRGLERARGKYFMFVDPDDILPPQALSALYRAGEEFDADIVKGNNDIFSARRSTRARYNASRKRKLDDADVLTTLFEHDQVRGHPWGKLFRREGLGQFRFPQGVRMAQDLFYCSQVFAAARSLLLLDETVYRYRDRDSGSTGRKFDSGSYLDWLDSVENTGQFANTEAQRRAHKNLLVRTLTQLARESRELPPGQAQEVLSVIEQRCDKWQISLPALVFRDRLGLRSISRYFRMRSALRETRAVLAKARSASTN